MNKHMRHANFINKHFTVTELNQNIPQWNRLWWKLTARFSFKSVIHTSGPWQTINCHAAHDTQEKNDKIWYLSFSKLNYLLTYFWGKHWSGGCEHNNAFKPAVASKLFTGHCLRLMINVCSIVICNKYQLEGLYQICFHFTCVTVTTHSLWKVVTCRCRFMLHFTIYWTEMWQKRSSIKVHTEQWKCYATLWTGSGRVMFTLQPPITANKQ